MSGPEDERHRYGQHYTPREVARILAAFAIRSSTDLILDPSCGDGRLLEEAIRLKEALSSKGKRRSPNPTQEAFGIDRSPSAIRLASQVRASVSVADFFDVEAGSSMCGSIKLPPGFDAIIGNPPYIRQELMGPRDKRRIDSRLELDRARSPEIFWPRWSGRSDIYVYFFAHSIRLLKAGGRLVFLTASSWLDAGYGAALREFLLKNFRLIAVIESAVESFFADASIDTVITVLERESGKRARDASLVRFVHLTAPLSDLVTGDGLDDYAVRFARAIVRTDSSGTTDAGRIRLVRQEDLLAEGAQARGPAIKAGSNKQGAREGWERPLSEAGWGKYLRADDVFFKVIERGCCGRLRRLSELARVRFGIKTGANEFFYVKDASRNEAKAIGARVAPGPSTGARVCRSSAVRQKAKSRLLASGEVDSTRHGPTTGACEFFNLKPADRPPPNSAPHDSRRLILVEDVAGRRFAIESQYLAPVAFSLREIPGIVFERVESRKLFFNCALTRGDLAGTKALDYIRRGERAGYSLRPTCAARGLWYSVASGMKPAPLIFPSKVGERWLVALNRTGAFEDKKLYGVFPRKSVPKLLLVALLNSTWARYYTEVTCRQMIGAQAIADIDVAVAEHLMIPDPRELSPSIKKRLESAIVVLARRPIYSVFEEVNRADRRQLDRLALRAIGFTDRREREAILNQLYAAVTNLVRARLNKGGGRKA
ncbi:MAG TPA: N-6 DNA methylase [Blastocatellia bacterium]